MAINDKADIHPVFHPFCLPTLTNAYIYLKNKYPDTMLLIMTDHLVENDFFWELNTHCIDINRLIPKKSVRSQPIIPLPYDSTNDEFVNLYSKIKKGTMLLDRPTFERLTFKNKDPFYFYSNRIVIHKNGEITFYGGRKF